MYKVILIPLDGSKRAERILPHVEGLARGGEAELVFLRVVEPIRALVGPHGTVIDLNVMEQLEEEATNYIYGVSGEFSERGFKAKDCVEKGPRVGTIIGVAKREGVDLVAMASHGRSGLARVFYGSVAAGVLQRVDRPLLLIRALD